MNSTFSGLIEKFASQGEKTGWTFVRLSSELAEKINPGVRVAFRVKGMLDQLPIEKTTLLPMGDGDFVFPLNAGLRKKLRKKAGDTLCVNLKVDTAEYKMNELLMECLQDDAPAMAHFNTFPPSHQRYFSKWVDSAKTEATIARRVAQVLNAMHQKQNYAEMIRSNKGLKQTPS